MNTPSLPSLTANQLQPVEQPPMSDVLHEQSVQNRAARFRNAAKRNVRAVLAPSQAQS